MPTHDEEFMSGQLFIKDENAQYTPYPGIQDCTATIATELGEDGQEWSYEGIDWAAVNGSYVHTASNETAVPENDKVADMDWKPHAAYQTSREATEGTGEAKCSEETGVVCAAGQGRRTGLC